MLSCERFLIQKQLNHILAAKVFLMKKTIVTLSFLSLFSLVGNAQTQGTDAPPAPQSKRAFPQQSQQKSGGVNVDQHSDAAPANAEDAHAPVKEDKNAPAKADDKNTAKSDVPKDRHAITEKGVPASKNKEQKPADTKKSQPVIERK
jgi:hypothetical protein